MKKIFSVMVLFFLAISCCTSKHCVYELTDTQLFFGSSGGFTNAKLEYVLNDDGKIFKVEGDSIHFIRKISRSQLKKLNQMLDDCKFKEIQLNSPGNMSYFMELKSSNGANKVVWSEKTGNPVEVIYKELFNLLKN
ncbi:MAG TPA: hypothetical protein PKH79_03805 [Prolixibacteraceae bacterium]|nr:hypothetical protein [Prolixibacteraceae bacterium]HPS13832.1 hypothetical protein [Prolixibacteraceae bacterium]